MSEAAPRPTTTAGGLPSISGWAVRIVVVLALVAFAIPLCRRSIVLADEGYILAQSWDLLNGKMLYRDMDAFVAPGMWIVLAATFRLLGPSVIASRVPVFFALLAMYGSGYRATARLAGPRYGLLALALLVVCTVWAFPAWTFAFYSPFSVTFVLVALERLLAWRDAQRRRDLVLCGLAAGLSIVFKQNYGVFAVVGLALGALSIRLEQGLPAAAGLRAWGRDTLFAAAGTLAAGLPVAVWLLAEGAFGAAWHSLVVHPFEFGHVQGIPYLPLSAIAEPSLMKSGTEMLTYAAQPVYRVPPAIPWVYQIGLVERMHVLFYWAPPLVLALGLALSYWPDAGREVERPRRVDAGLFSVSAVAGLVFLGVFPRADFNHLVNVYQPIVLAGVVVAHRLLAGRPTPHRWPVRVAVAGTFAVLGLYAAVAGFWYVGLLERLDSKILVPRGGVLDTDEQAQRVDYEVRTIQAETRPDQALLTVPDLSMLNFLADRPMPSAYYNLYAHHIEHDGGAAVVKGDLEHGGPLAITRFNDFFSDRLRLREYAPALVDYLKTHYEMKYTVGHEDFIHLERRSEPRPLPDSRSILPWCDTSRGYQTVREHLLFPALYHDPGTGGEMPAATIETPCDVPVPKDGAVFEVRLGYRAPAAVVKDTTLTLEVLAVGPREKLLLARKVFDVKPSPRFPRREPVPPDLRIDLRQWAGRTVRLILRTVRRGQVYVRPLEPRGFGSVWEDPRIVLDAPAPPRRAEARP